MGNHTYGHPRLTQQSDAQIRSQVSRGAASTSSKPVLRYPFGEGFHHVRVDRVVRRMGYQPCLWTSDTRDWSRASARGMANLVRNGDTKGPPVFGGGVVLMHTQHYTAAKLNAVVYSIRTGRNLQIEALR